MNNIVIEFSFSDSNLTEVEIVNIIFDAIRSADEHVTIGAFPKESINEC